MSLLAAAALGIGLGVITGMPLGVINVAIVDAALARRAAYAAGLGVGGALADTTHALLAFVGLGRLVTARPELVRGLAIAAAIVIAAYAVIGWRRARGGPPPRPDQPDVDRGADPGGGARGVAAGALLTLPNPGALAAWVAVAAALWPDATTAEAIALGAGVGVGSAAWFVALGRLVARVRPDHPWLRHVPRVALVAFVAIAIAGLVRAI